MTGTDAAMLADDSIKTATLPARNRSSWDIQRAVVFALFVRELQTRFGGRWLGAFWVLFEPLAHLILLMLLYTYVRMRVLPGVDYPVYLLAGLVPFFLFRNLVLRGMDAVDANRGLFGYRQVKPIDPLFSRAILETILYATVYLATLGMLAWTGLRVLPARPLELLGIAGLLVFTGFALGLALAVLTDGFPHSRSFIRVAFLPLYLASGVLFPIASLPPDILPWLLWNPVLHAIERMRGAFFPQYRVLVDTSTGYVFAFAALSLAIALALYRQRRYRLLAS